jgi:hypothetical protein
MPVSSFLPVARATSGNENRKMALHREVYWVGRQWAVTGYGIQACDQKQKSKFDIDASRLWEDGVLENMRALKWLNIEDFEQAISVARKHFPELPRQAAPPEENTLGLMEAVPVEAPKPAAQTFDMRIEGWPAKFVPQWRIRIRR